jgi:transcriptional regulator with XRE-family HTH domain
MSLFKMQERVRAELLRRIERGTLSVSLLARQTGLGQPHISNFLHNRRGLSLKGLDKILEAQRLQVEDLMPARREESKVGELAAVEIPLVTHAIAIFDPHIRASSALSYAPFRSDTVRGLEPRCSNARRQWDRFVAVKMNAEEGQGMEPVVRPDAIVLLDRHYTSFRAWHGDRPNLYGARLGANLVVRYAQFQADRLILRAHQAHVKAEVIEPGLGETANDLLVGRVVSVVNDP